MSHHLFSVLFVSLFLGGCGVKSPPNPQDDPRQLAALLYALGKNISKEETKQDAKDMC